MAQAGFTPIQLYNSATSTNAPTAGNLAAGELAINTADGKLFYKDSSGVVQVIGWKTTPITAGGTGQTTATAAFDALAPTTTQGDTIYYNGTDNVRLPKGTAGQALVMNSGATAPEWGTAGISTGKAIAMAMIFGF
jgi:hypothetical protein